MASVGPKLTIPFVVGSGQIVGQGPLPILWALIAFDDMTVSTPHWVDVTDKVRSFSISRTEGETGTCTLTLDNRTRAFDPTFVSSPYYPNVRPMNKVWLLAQFTGETNSMYFGYTESYDQQWPGGGWSDAIAIATCADELKMMTVNRLPLTNPPRTNYQDLVAFDNPSSYWPMDEDSASRGQPPAISVIDSSASSGSSFPASDDKFELGQLTGKTPQRKHAKKPIGKKKPLKTYDASGNRVYPGPRPLKRPRRH